MTTESERDAAKQPEETKRKKPQLFDEVQRFKTFPEIFNIYGTGERYIFRDGVWYRFTVGTGWKAVSQQSLESTIGEMAIALSTDGGLSNATLSRRINEIRARVSVPENVQGDFFIGMEAGGFRVETKPAENWIATRSHYINILTGETLPMDGSLFTPGCVPCDYDPAATCPRWEQYVAEACPDDAEAIQTMFGLSLTPKKYGVFYILYGDGGSGKSTAMETLEALNTGATCSVSLGDFGERFQTYPLSVCRVNLVSDMESIFEGDGRVSRREGVIKRVTMGESDQFERKHQRPEHRRYTALCVFASNSFPTFSDRSKAIPDRLRTIYFPNNFRDSGREVANLSGWLIENELPGILNWSIAGLRAFVCSGLARPAESETAKAMKAEQIKNSRPEELFCDDCIVEDPGNRVDTVNLYEAYRKYCYARGRSPMGSNTVIPAIVKYLQKKYSKVDKYRGRVGGVLRMMIKGVFLNCDNNSISRGNDGIPW
ncbi:MAG: primase-like DNA-binding domain-containing protein [Planctomycetia bacterium]|nr:primase-like DNA-binding domain-containing protein [Planctomycetia bacterium]